MAETAAKLSGLSRCINKPDPSVCVCEWGVSHQELGELSEHTLHVLLFPSLISALQAFPPCTALPSISQMTRRCTCDSARVAWTPPAVQRRSFWKIAIPFYSCQWLIGGVTPCAFGALQSRKKVKLSSQREKHSEVCLSRAAVGSPHKPEIIPQKSELFVKRFSDHTIRLQEKLRLSNKQHI